MLDPLGRPCTLDSTVLGFALHVLPALSHLPVQVTLVLTCINIVLLAKTENLLFLVEVDVVQSGKLSFRWRLTHVLHLRVTFTLLKRQGLSGLVLVDLG